MKILVDENIPLLRRPNRHTIALRIMEGMSLFSSRQGRGLLVVMRDTVMSTWRVGTT